MSDPIAHVLHRYLDQLVPARPGELARMEADAAAGSFPINALWSGRIFDAADRSGATEGVRELTHLFTTSDRWSSTIVPIRDGLLVARRAD
jgi:hypothetical protein